MGWYMEMCGALYAPGMAISWALVSMPLGGTATSESCPATMAFTVGYLSPEGDIRIGLELGMMTGAPGSIGLCGSLTARLRMG